jgi:hypothetical protein
MSSLLEKMMSVGAATTRKQTALLSKSAFFNIKEMTKTELPILNIAFSGSLDGGLVPGLTVLAGESKTFKTMTALYCMKAYLNKHPDGIALLYDSEFGITPEYIASFDIDTSRVLHIPIKDVEELKQDLSIKLKDVGEKDRMFIMIDSVGNLASRKEVEDAENEKTVADMSRAKSLKSLFRIITPHLTTKNIPCIAINHVYKEIGAMYAKTIVGGGCVVAGTEIQTPNGLKKVEDFRPGDVVLTNYGENTISHVWNPSTLEEGTPECYEITFDDGNTVVCSDNHKFLIAGNWISAKDLIVGMECETLKT